MAITKLNAFFQRCLERRVTAPEFHELLEQLQRKSHYSSRDVVAAFINCNISFSSDGDPLVPRYLQTIVLHGIASTSDFLTALLVQWNHVKSLQQQNVVRKIFEVHSRIAADLQLIIGTGLRMTASEAQKSIYLAAKWLQTSAKWTLSEQGKQTAPLNLTDHIGSLLVLLLNANPVVASNPDLHTVQNAIQGALNECMGAFPSITVGIMNRANAVRKSDFEGGQDQVEMPSPNALNLAAFEFEANIPENTIIPHRCATTALLNKLIRDGSTIDDASVFGFLNTRYQGQPGAHAAMFNEIAMASVDALYKSQDTSHAAYQDRCQTYLLNKLPSILASIVGSAYEPFSSADLLTDMWNYVSALANADATTTVRRFMHICAVHHLIPAEVVVEITGEAASGLTGFQSKDDLLAQVVANHSRGPKLVEELLQKDGNAMSISRAVTDVIHNYCHGKETQHLRDMSNAIIRRPAAIDTLAMMIQPAYLLAPLCLLLDDWKWEEIHGESQPVYDEFGSILLLVVAFRQRLHLSLGELGIQRPNDFLAKYLVSMHSEKELSKLTDTEVTHLDAWVKALYIDEGLSDELTKGCSAQSFYLLVPTLLRQSVLAQSCGRLSKEALKTGLEYLLEPFLLPSLLSGFAWMAKMAAKEPARAAMIVQVFCKTPSTAETKEIHQTILSIAAEAFTGRTWPKDSALETALKPITSLTAMHLGGSVTPAQIVQWAATDGSIEAVLSRSMAAQTNPDNTFSPDLVQAMLQASGPFAVVRTSLNVLLQYSGETDFHLLLDFIATVLTTADERAGQALQVLHADLGTLVVRQQTHLAEAIVHLHRRVELYTSVTRAQTMAMEQTFVPMAGLSVANVNLDAGATATFDQGEPAQTADIDQVWNDAAALEGMESIENVNLDDMYGLQGDNFDLGNLDLDMSMF